MIFDGDPMPPVPPDHLSPWFLPVMIVIAVVGLGVIIFMVREIIFELEDAERKQYNIF